MITWGISANSHNASLSVFDGDALLFASESERFSRIKNDAYLNDGIIRYAKKFGEPELVCWYENPYKKTARQLLSGQGLIKNSQKYADVPIKYYDHHYTHACAGYFTSKFYECCVVVIDAIGEFQTLTIWEAQGNTLKLKYQLRYPHSIGLWYSAMTQRCGLKPNEEEYILMGMSAYGDSDRLVNDIYEDFIGDDLKFKRNLHKGCKNWRPDLTSQQDMFDIAAATQRVYENLFREVLQLAKIKVKSGKLVLMGGCALNCSANPIAYQYYDDVWIMPAPGDSGSSIGAVLAHKKKHIKWTGPYLGYDMGYKTSNAEIIDHLMQEKVCGIARGRAEFGPRALGNRSLIADPRDPNIKSIVNNIKQRQQFRPFSPVILEDNVDDYFEMPTNRSQYMQYTVKCKKPEDYPGIVHADGTSRVQTLRFSDNPRFYTLLSLWYNKTNCPMLLNTSLNIKGQPMVNDGNDCFDWQNKYKITIFN
jgi:carbamoyltransferase